MRRRETFIDDTKHIFEKTSTDVTVVVDQFKKEFPSKTMITIEPLLNAILTNNNINADDQEKLITSIHDQINIYYYMNSEILIKLINYAASSDMKKKLKKVKKNPIDVLDTDEYDSLNKNQKEIYLIRFDNLVDRYIKFLMDQL